MSVNEIALDPTRTKSQQEQVNQFADLLQNNDFLMDIAKDLGIDNIEDTINEVQKAEKEEKEKKKKEEEDKKQ